MMQEGTRGTVSVEPTPLANEFGNALTENTIGHEAALAEHYRRILLAAPLWHQWRAARRGCFDVDIVISIEGEHELRLEMFNGAAFDAGELLMRLADLDAPPGTLYDNLDQGWKLRMVSTPDAVFTLEEWNWECPAIEDRPRALRFPRSELAVQAVSALARLRHVHGALVRDIGVDIWNQPPAEPEQRRKSWF
jgi:hypothetical protein